jgi:phosphate transport system substrate-binding protein
VANSTTAIELLLKGQLTFVQSGRPLQATEKQQAQNQGIQLQEIPVVLDGIAIAVHPSLPIQGITLADVGKIYKGQITNWKQLGGPDLRIAPYSLPVESEEVVNLFFQKVMQGDAYGDQLNYFPNMTAALRQLAHSPGGIFFGSAAEIVNQCSIKPLAIGKNSQNWIPPYRLPYVTPRECPLRRNQINTEAFQTQQYPLTHPLFVIFKAQDDPGEKAGKAYANMLLTDQGQELIAKAGFVSMDNP